MVRPLKKKKIVCLPLAYPLKKNQKKLRAPFPQEILHSYIVHYYLFNVWVKCDIFISKLQFSNQAVLKYKLNNLKAGMGRSKRICII